MKLKKIVRSVIKAAAEASGLRIVRTRKRRKPVRAEAPQWIKDANGNAMNEQEVKDYCDRLLSVEDNGDAEVCNAIDRHRNRVVSEWAAANGKLMEKARWWSHIEVAMPKGQHYRLLADLALIPGASIGEAYYDARSGDYWVTSADVFFNMADLELFQHVMEKHATNYRANFRFHGFRL